MHFKTGKLKKEVSYTCLTLLESQHSHRDFVSLNLTTVPTLGFINHVIFISIDMSSWNILTSFID
ncbi:MAG TPA: hypothetical protein VFG24_06370 [Nitrosopumilaceae archaeon]|nr:hypothetical protein [Nitrosopumilaceae archaeon]